MFLSRVEISWGSAANPYNLHKALWDLFPGHEKEQRQNSSENRSGFLYRVERNVTGQMAGLLVQSQVKPTAESKRTNLLGSKEFNPKPVNGQRLAFVLTANPVKTITDRQNRIRKKDGKVKNCRVPLIKEEQQLDWLAKKLNGVANLISVRIQKEAPIYFYKRKKDEVINGKLVPITYEGILEVKDSQALIEKMQNGIGPAKAFGCGLLLVRRL